MGSWQQRPSKFERQYSCGSEWSARSELGPRGISPVPGGGAGEGPEKGPEPTLNSGETGARGQACCLGN